MWQNCTVEIQANVLGEGRVPAGITPTLQDAHVFARTPTAQQPGTPIQVVLYDATGSSSIAVLAQAVRNVHAADGQMAGVLMRLNLDDPSLEPALLQLIGHGSTGHGSTGHGSGAAEITHTSPVDTDPSAIATGLSYLQDAPAPAPNTDVLPEALQAVLRRPGVAESVHATAGTHAAHEEVPEIELEAEMLQVGTVPVKPAESAVPANWRESLRIYEKGGRIREAVDLLRKVLDESPMDMDLHLKLGELAVKIENLKLAQWHAEFVTQMEPKNTEAATLLSSIHTRRSEINARRQKNKISRKVARAIRSPSGRAKILLGVLSFATIVTTGVWNYLRFFKPSVPPVTTVQKSEVADILPAKDVKLFEQRLYITVDSKWFALGPDRQMEALEILRSRAKTKYDVAYVALIEPGPKVIATINGKNIQILR